MGRGHGHLATLDSCKFQVGGYYVPVRLYGATKEAAESLINSPVRLTEFTTVATMPHYGATKEAELTE
jgi:hypothetical protein